MVNSLLVFFILFPLLLMPLLNPIFFNLSFNDFLALYLWYFNLLMVGFTIQLTCKGIFNKLWDLGAGISKTLGFLILGYFCWIFYHFNLGFLAKYLNFLLPLLLLIIQILLIKFYKPGKKTGADFSIFLRHVLTVEALFSWVFVLLLISVTLHPNIFASEKNMDFSLINFFIRSMELPATDPWAAGHKMNYYYLGHYYFANLIKFAYLPPSIGFNVAVATVPCLMAAAAYSLFGIFFRRFLITVFAALCLIILSNFKAAINIFFYPGKIDFSYFWSSSRILAQNYFVEFPSWSFLLGDLHPHFMGYPICLTFITMVIYYLNVINKDILKSISFIIKFGLLFSIVWGAMIGINTWDYLIMSFIFLFLILVNIDIKSTLKEIVKRSFLLPLIFFLAAVLIYLPVILMIKVDRPKTFNLVMDGINGFSHFFLQSGQWWIIIIFMSLIYLLFSKRKVRINITSLFLSLIPLYWGIIGYFWGAEKISWFLLAFLSLFLYSSMLIKDNRISTLSKRYLVIFSFVSVGLLLVSDNFVLIDRINTFFKFQNHVWIFGFMATFLLTPHFIFFWIKSVEKFDRWFSKVSVGLLVFIFCLLGFLELATYFNLYAVTKSHLKAPTGLTLDGKIFMKKKNGEDYLLINWISKNVQGVPTVIEYYGKTYDYDTPRICMFTGLPAFVAWPGQHLLQRGMEWKKVLKRKKTVIDIYNSTDAIGTYKLLKKRNIKLVVVGNLEQRNFDPAGLEKFEKYGDFFKPLVRFGNTVLYVVL